MPFRPVLGPTLAAASMLASAPGTVAAQVEPPAPCLPARAADGVSSQPPEVREAVARLVAATGRPGPPWSCRGGTLDVRARADGGFDLEVGPGDTGRTITRTVRAIDDVVPLAEALLALPTVADAEPVAGEQAEEAPKPPAKAPPAAPAAPKSPPSRASASDGAAPTPPGSRPDLLLDALLDVRYAAPSEAILIGPRLGASLSLGRDGAWLVGVWARAAGTADRLARGPGLSEIVGGASFGTRRRLGPIDARASVGLAAAVEIRDLPRPLPAETSVAPRVALDAGIAIPATSSLRFLALAGGELSPTHVADEEPTDERAPFPAVSASLAAGVELAWP